MRKLSRTKRLLMSRYIYWPGFKSNYLKFRYCQIYKALKMYGRDI